jgi:hypothetical protein
MMRLTTIGILINMTLSLFSNNQVDSIRVKKDLAAILSTPKARNYKNIEELDQVADYIVSEFKKSGGVVSELSFHVDGKKYRNIICSFDTSKKERIIVGAHYDVCGNQPGADDNATGVAGLLELARLLKDQKLKYRIDLVAFTLEEPPFFSTNKMGSYVHAKYLHDNHIKVKGMICLEMIGYFSNEPGSQTFPFRFLKMFYGDKGNFITLARRLFCGRFARHFSRLFRKNCSVISKIFRAPHWLQGIALSDHRNYWHFGYSTLMITDSAFYRNFNYHQSSDTIQTLNIEKMCGVIEGVFQGLINY